MRHPLLVDELHIVHVELQLANVHIRGASIGVDTELNLCPARISAAGAERSRD
jgi:hypothetical protein